MMNAPTTVVGTVARTVRQVGGGQKDAATVTMSKLGLYHRIDDAAESSIPLKVKARSSPIFLEGWGIDAGWVRRYGS